MDGLHQGYSFYIIMCARELNLPLYVRISMGEEYQFAMNYFQCLLPTGSEGREVLWIGSTLVAILPSCHNMKANHYNCINMNIVG